MAIDSVASLLADATGSVVWETAGERIRYLYFSPRFERLLGYSADQWLAEPDFWREHLHAEDADRCIAAREAAVRDCVDAEVDYRMIAADGRAVWLRDVMRVVRDSRGEPALSGVTIDVSAAKLAEHALRWAELRMQVVLHSTTDAVWDWNLADDTVWWSEGMTTLFGYAPGKIGGTIDWWSALIHPDDRAEVDEVVRRLLEGIQVDWRTEYRLARADGTWAYVLDRGRAIRGREGRPQRMIGALVDITERRASEEAHREREERLARQNRALRELTRRETVFFHGFAAAVREITEVAAQTLGVERVSIWLIDPDRQAMRAVDLYELESGHHTSGHMLDAAAVPAYFAALESEPVIAADDAMNDPRTREFANGYLESHGIVSMLDAGILIGGRIAGVLCHEHVGVAREWSFDEQTFAAALAGLASVAFEVSERAAVEQALRESEERYRIVAETATDAILTIDEAGKILFASAAAEPIFGYRPEELVGESLEVILPDAMHRWHEEGLETRAVHRSGAEIPVEVSFGEYRGGGQHLFTGIVRDVSERGRLEDQLRQAQRMEAVGRLAGGVAHDFNNLLTVITGFAGLALQQLHRSDPMRPNLEEVVRAGQRAATLTRQLLAFSRRQMLEPRVLDLNAVITDLSRMLERLIGEDVELALLLDPNPRSVRADPGQIEQVIANLAVNARDAMPEGGTLTVATKVVELDTFAARARGLGGSGTFVVLSVKDTGVGMDDETLEHVFEPFFTTKEVGKGTGLGLSTVYGIVTQSGGAITVESAPSRGTTFDVYLPAFEGAVDERAAATAEARVPLGSETILISEDERSVRKLATEVLKAAGYRVLEAENAGEALLISEAHEGPIHLLLTDVVMPKMSGRKLAERLAAERPAMKVLYMSGYTEDAILHHGITEERAAFLAKPFSPEELGRRVREVLDS